MLDCESNVTLKSHWQNHSALWSLKGSKMPGLLGEIPYCWWLKNVRSYSFLVIMEVSNGQLAVFWEAITTLAAHCCGSNLLESSLHQGLVPRDPGMKLGSSRWSRTISPSQDPECIHICKTSFFHMRYHIHMFEIGVWTSLIIIFTNHSPLQSVRALIYITYGNLPVKMNVSG